MRVLTGILRRLYRNPFAVVLEDDQREWKAYELLLGAWKLASLIEERSDRPHVGFMLPTGGLAPMAILAGWFLGRTVVPVNYLLKTEERDYVLRDAELDAVVTVGPMLERFGALPEGVQAIRLEELRERKGLPRPRRAPRRPDDFLSILLYTSGTSGRPKGVMLTSGNLASNIDQANAIVHFTKDDRMVGVIPQFHSFGLTVLTLLPLTLGVRVRFTAQFMPKRMKDLIAQERATILVLIPSMYGAMLGLKSATADDFSSLRLAVSGGEPLPEAVANGFLERFGVRINEGYGLTETSPVTNVCLPEQFKPKSVGPPVPRCDIRIVAADGDAVPIGEEGEIRIAGPNVTQGYYKLPQETAEAFDADGYFRTGDMGRLDGDGHLYITGRIKEMLIVGGENVFPREIEEVLNAHPQVQASAVIGLADGMRGEVPLGFVELVEDADPASVDPAELRRWCRDRLAPYKVPREVRRVEALPRNPTGKIMRRELSAEVPDLAGEETTT